MKTIKLLWLSALLPLVACSSQPEDEPQGMGTITVNTTIDQEDSQSRGSSLLDGCKIFISNDQGRIRSYTGIQDVPDKIWLLSGAYGIEVYAGDSVDASWDQRYYKGYKAFEVTAGNNTPVDVTCRLANVLASVKVDEKLKIELSDYQVTIGHSRASLIFEKDEQRPGIYMMPQGSTSLDWELTATTKDGRPIAKKGTIRNVEPANEYILNLSYSGQLPEMGSASLDVAIDASIVVVNQDVTFNQPPVITLDGMDINAVHTYEKGNTARHAIVVQAAAGLKSVTLASDQFTLLGIEDVTSFDVFNPSAETVASLYAKGINMVQQENHDGSSVMVINFSKKLCDLLQVAEYQFTVTALDLEDNSSNASLMITINEP